MLHKQQENKTSQVQMVSVEELVPKNHLLRKIDKYIYFDFIYDLVEDKYCLDNGRPSIDPVVLMKIVFIQYLFNIKSMRQTIKEIEVNIAYRWFLGFGFNDKIPHFTTFSQNYRRRFKDTDIFNEIFNKILTQASKKNLVDSSILFVDATHVKAHANRHKNKKVEIEQSAKYYQEELNKEIDKDRKAHDKKPLKTKEEKKETKKITQSTTDPESGLFHKGEHKEVFAYCVQTACDKNGWLLGYEAFPGNLHDSTTFTPFYQNEIKNLKPEKIVMDAGYKTPSIARMLIKDGVLPVLPYTAPRKKPNVESPLYKRDFVYDEYYDCYICPQEEILKYSTTDRNGYKLYKSDPKKCEHCPYLQRCTESKNHQKVVSRHIWQDYLDVSEEYRYTKKGKEEYKRRKETIERQFGSAKEFHGFRYTNMKGIQKMQMKAALTFACLNMKKLAKMLWKMDPNGGLLADKISNFYENARNLLENLIFTRTNPGKPGFVFNLNNVIYHCFFYIFFML
ncbi:TPA: IS1182 family transposase [Streptococcus pyogenes]